MAEATGVVTVRAGVRGRPREFNRADVLDKITVAMLANGVDSTSLDLLTSITGIKRPSLRLAFGEKKDIVRVALASYCQKIERALKPLSNEPIERALRLTFRQLATIFTSTAYPATGCFLLLVIASSYMVDEKTCLEANGAILDMTATFERRFKAEFNRAAISASPEVFAQACVAFTHLIATRARIGATRTDLLAMGNEFAALISNRLQGQSPGYSPTVQVSRRTGGSFRSR